MRNGNWMQTYSGIKFYPLDPHPEDIRLVDIAHALALTCRFNGHCRVFYSVAEHCVRMATNDLPGSPKWRLFHDAAEAYICDLPSPLKYSIPDYKMYEDNIVSVIAGVFSLGPMDKQAIKHADLTMLATEKRDIITDGPTWKQLPEPLPGIISAMTWRQARDAFLFVAGRIL